MDSSSDLENENLIKSNCDNSYLSESSDNLTDYSSETSTLKKIKYNTKYPTFYKSNNINIKKNISENKIQNIVNEEQNEDDNETEKMISPRKFGVHPSEVEYELSKFGKIRNKSFRENSYLGTLYEIKEESCPDAVNDKKSLNKHQTPQIKYLIDNIEDTKICPTFFGSNHIHNYKFDYTNEEHTITEDHNENYLENITDMRKSASKKKIESFIDKSENFEEQLNIRKSVADSYIEPIKEENIEEEENIYTSNFHPFNKNCEFILSDEKVLSNITNLKYKLSLKSSNFEEINKIIDELDDDL